MKKEGWSKEFSFKCARGSPLLPKVARNGKDARTADEPAPVRFLALADHGVAFAGGAPQKTASNLLSESTGVWGPSGSDVPPPTTRTTMPFNDFVLHPGDVAYGVGAGWRWDAYGSMMQPLIATVPYMVSLQRAWTSRRQISFACCSDHRSDRKARTLFCLHFSHPRAACSFFCFLLPVLLCSAAVISMCVLDSHRQSRIRPQYKRARFRHFWRHWTKLFRPQLERLLHPASWRLQRRMRSGSSITLQVAEQWERHFLVQF